MKHKMIVFLGLIVSLVLFACGKTTNPDNSIEKSQAENTQTAKPIISPAVNPTTDPAGKGKIILATTTSTQDSGLLDELLPKFMEKTGWEVDTIAVGTGEALEMGKNGEADVLLVHAKAKEEAFIQEGYGLKRYDVMYNDFVIVGPAGEIEKNNDVDGTFHKIFNQHAVFVSRGDESGTHTKELSIWKNLNINPADNPNYISAGQGMGATLLMAEEKKAYTISDRATWLTVKAKTTLDIVCEKDAKLLNYYGVIAVNPDIDPKIQAEGAQAFIDWILSPDTQKLIGDFGAEEYGEPLFTPNASANK